MPTPSEAVARNELFRVDGVLDAHEQPARLLYITPRAVQWLNTNLENMASDGFYDNAATPAQQADDLFYSFIVGEDIAADLPPHVMLPAEDGIWELRTPDLRMFGWFWRKGVFIISAINSAEMCKKHSLYAGYRNQAVGDRMAFNFEPPPFVNGGLNDVI
ncbi:hypothetical protein JET14_06160 [Martelella lutilitoris]|uniref:Uncharacterized protein n=1 Tax=Martelella lutilitoris TaxID=2583532 RepID=A0A7T7HM38_9HYPH|nr:hypothetical protein [Martelella lutilitoris]QQM31749.1 hypothetical protein JET14_06160 [Martelella lutilitoris]